MRKPRYWEVLVVLTCIAFLVGSLTGIGAISGMGIVFLIFSVLKFFEYLDNN